MDISTPYLVLKAYNEPLWDSNNRKSEITQMYHHPHAFAPAAPPLHGNLPKCIRFLYSDALPHIPVYSYLPAPSPLAIHAAQISKALRTRFAA